MSSIATFYRLKESNLIGLRETAGTPGSRFWDYLRARGERVLEFHGSGYVFGTVLPYLEENHAVDLAKSQHEDLVNFLSKSRDALVLLLTLDQQTAHLEKLNQSAFDIANLNTYYNEFNETDEPGAGEAMAEGIAALEKALIAVRPDSVVLLYVG